MSGSVKRFDNKKTFPGREVKRTIVRHAKTAKKGRAARFERAVKSYVH